MSNNSMQLTALRAAADAGRYTTLAMKNDGKFDAAYRALEDRMKKLAETDGDVFLPSPQPEGPVHHVLICMEPSLGRWARSQDEARSKVEAGFRNFLL